MTPERSAAAAPTAASGLAVRLDSPIPQRLPVNRPTAIFCSGTCFHRRLAVLSLRITVDGIGHRPTAHRMPRLDLFRSLHPSVPPGVDGDPDSIDDPQLLSYRSGFWATLPIPAASRSGEIGVRIDAVLADGTSASAPLGVIEVFEPSGSAAGTPRAPSDDAGLIAICMATFNPDPVLLGAQIESLRAQTDKSWVCVVSDDCSASDRFEVIKAQIGSDSRFVLSRADRRLGFYRNFERALGMVPAEAEFVALCDQDDRWYPEKLEVLRGAIAGAPLAYSDLRMVDESGAVLTQSLWERRRHDRPTVSSLLVANTIPGPAALLRRRVTELALPFPEAPGWQFHDHWIALVASALGDLAYVDRPLYDYVQHRGAVLGGKLATGGRSIGPAEPGRRDPVPQVPGRMNRWRAAYFYLYLSLEIRAEVLLARCSAELNGRERRTLRRLIAADRSLIALIGLAARRVRAPLSRSPVDRAAGVLSRAVLWRRLVSARAGSRETPDGGGLDASAPPFDPDIA